MRYQNYTFFLSAAALLMSVTSSAAVPPCPNPPILFWDACFGAFIYPGQSSYEGEWELGKHSGYGTYKFSNGNKYVGEFKENLLNGQGTYDFANGNLYIFGFLVGNYGFRHRVRGRRQQPRPGQGWHAPREHSVTHRPGAASPAAPFAIGTVGAARHGATLRG